MSFNVLVLGIGNNLLSDEGAGVHVLGYLQRHHPDLPGVRYLDGGTLSFTLAEPIARCDGLIVVDAARLDEPAGTVRRFEGEAMDRYLRGKRGSVHEVSLGDLLDMARLTGDLPEHRCLVGIQPQSLDWGDGPTAAVAQVIPEAAGEVLACIRRWQADGSPLEV